MDAENATLGHRPSPAPAAKVTATGRIYMSSSDYMRQPEVQAQMAKLQASKLWQTIAERQRRQHRA